MALLHVNFFSEVLGMSMNMDVILPQETKAQIGMKGRVREGKCPTLYLLHGMSDDHTIWQRRTSIERYVSEMGLAVVMPTTHLAWYTNTQYGIRYWDFISEELPQICRSLFPQLSDRREDTFAAGLSMGGYGAFKLGLRCPEAFGAVASLSGALDVIGEYQDFDMDQRAPFWEGIFGNLPDAAGGENDLMAAAEELAKSARPKPKLYMWCGRQDFLYQQNLTAAARLRELGYDVTFEESDGGHEWTRWDAKIQDILAWLPLEKER